MAKVPEFLDDLDIISKLGNNPGPDDGLEPDPLKSKFDEAGNKIKAFINTYIIPALNNYIAGTDGLLNLTGGTMKGDINLDGKHRITRMADPKSAQDGATKAYTDEKARALSESITEVGNAKVSLSGGTMRGELNMGNNAVKNIPAPVDAGDAVNKAFLESFCGKVPLLWTNPAPKKVFRPQTVSVDLSAYDAVIIEATIWHETDYKASIFAIKGSSARLFACDTQVLSYRNAAVTNTGVQFEAGYSQETISGGFSSENLALIPSRIYGAKFGGKL